MSESEVIVLLASIYFTFRFIMNWYQPIAGTRTLRRNIGSRVVLGILPVISFCMILYTLKELASFDVVTDFTYIMFYLLLGFTWIFFGLKLIFYFFDLSWIDDVLNMNNMAALVAMSGGFLAITMIYSGANIGDGPGWWTVIVAGGMGMIIWIVLALLIHKLTFVFERITVEQDVACGIRFGAYLLASGLILGRASGGDWTSFSKTIEEFFVGWPVLIVTLLALLVEVSYLMKSKENRDITKNSLTVSLFWSVIYLAIAIVSLSLYPLPQNPIYGSEVIGLIGGAL